MLNKIITSIKNFVHDPIGLRRMKRDLDTYYSLLKDDLHTARKETSKNFDEILLDYKKYAKKQEDKATFYCMSLEHIGDVLPDMIWMKWADTGKYAYANKSIRDGLLFDTDPVGKDDHQIGFAATEKFGASDHNFGAYCAGSDSVTIELGHRKRFIEYGMSGGKPLVLEVYKNVVRSTDNNDIIATVGCGRDITDNIFTMLIRLKYIVVR